MEKDTVKLLGGLLIHKEAGMTSFDVIRYLRRHFAGLPREARRAKWGHSGTLDPFATGVLIVLLGNATRLQDELHLLPKTYRATLTLGATSDTDDVTGKISPPWIRGSTQQELGRGSTLNAVEACVCGELRPHPCLLAGASPHTRGGNATAPTNQQILAALNQIKAQTSQIPPDYAAIKIQGQKMYDLAREGKTIVKKPRPIIIHDIQLEEYSYPTLKISVTCSTGTYIRSIARDIGDMLGTGGYCSALERTAIGPFTIKNAILLKDLPEDLTSVLIPLEKLVSHIESIELAEDNVANLKNGREVEVTENIPINTPITLLDQNKKLFGIGVRKSIEKVMKAKKVFL
ncbi:MAG: hypothetical protein AAB649_06250 [Patescibacteria group bacterium]